MKEGFIYQPKLREMQLTANVRPSTLKGGNIFMADGSAQVQEINAGTSRAHLEGTKLRPPLSEAMPPQKMIDTMTKHVVTIGRTMAKETKPDDVLLKQYEELSADLRNAQESGHLGFFMPLIGPAFVRLYQEMDHHPGLIEEANKRALAREVNETKKATESVVQVSNNNDENRPKKLEDFLQDAKKIVAHHKSQGTSIEIESVLKAIASASEGKDEKESRELIREELKKLTQATSRGESGIEMLQMAMPVATAPLPTPPAPNQGLMDVLSTINNEVTSKPIDPHTHEHPPLDLKIIEDQLKRVERLVDDGAPVNQANEVRSRLEALRQESKAEVERVKQDTADKEKQLYEEKLKANIEADERSEYRNFEFYLTKREIDRIVEGVQQGAAVFRAINRGRPSGNEIEALANNNAVQWLNERFDQIYNLAQGQELNSQILQTAEGRIGQVMALLLNESVKNTSPTQQRDIEAFVEEFEKIFKERVNLIFLRSMIQSRNLEQVKGMSQRLRAEGLLGALNLDGGRAQDLYFRMDELLEDTRLGDGENGQHHLYPQQSALLVDRVVQEQLGILQASGEIDRSISKNGINWLLSSKENREILKSALDNGMSFEEFRKSRLIYPNLTFHEYLSAKIGNPIILEEAIGRAIIDNYDIEHTKEINGNSAIFDAYSISEADYLRNRSADPQLTFSKYLTQKITNASDRSEVFKAMFEFDMHQQAEQQLTVEVRRSARVAYDVLVSSQRESQIAARGKHLYDATDVFTSDPAALFGSLWNLNDMLINKWGLLNANQERVRDAMYRDLAEDFMKENHIRHLGHDEKQNLGIKLFRDFWLPPDFYSSAWRMKEITKQLDRLMLYKVWQQKMDRGEKELTEAIGFKVDDAARSKRFRTITEGYTSNQTLQIRHGLSEAEQAYAFAQADNLGLFIRMRQLGTVTVGGHDNKEKQSKREELWKGIAKNRPEEIARLLYERAPDELNPFHGGDVYNQAGFNITNYNEFKTAFGSAVRYIQNQALRNTIPMQLNIGELKASDNFSDGRNILDTLATVLGPGRDDTGRVIATPQERAQACVQMYRELQQFIDHKHIPHLLVHDERFEDIYMRTLRVDDLPIGELQEPPRASGLLALDKNLSSDPGADALVRTFNDAENGIKAFQSIVGFLRNSESYEKSVEPAMAFADAVREYNGDGRASAVRYTLGTRLKMSATPELMELFGLERFPLFNTTEIQDAFGWRAEQMNKNTLRDHFLHIHDSLTQTIRLDEKEAQLSYWHRRWILRKKRKAAHHYAHQLEAYLGIRPTDFAKRNFNLFLLGLVIAAMNEGLQMGKAVGKAEGSSI